MDESIFIIVALVIGLSLIAGLYFEIDLLSQRALGFVGEARSREHDRQLGKAVIEITFEGRDA